MVKCVHAWTVLMVMQMTQQMGQASQKAHVGLQALQEQMEMQLDREYSSYLDRTLTIS